MFTPAQRDYTYKVTTQPTVLAVSLITAKSHLKVTGATEDALITLYINAAIDFCEKITRRDLITRTYTTFRDFFPSPIQNEGFYPSGVLPSIGVGGISSIGANIGFEIRKSPLQSIESIKHLVSGSLVTLDSGIFYNTLEEDYSEVLTVQSKDWPTNTDQRLQSIEISFKSGFGDKECDIPQSYKIAILQHLTALYSNRGDCMDEGSIPPAAKSFYLQNRIENL